MFFNELNLSRLIINRAPSMLPSHMQFSLDAHLLGWCLLRSYQKRSNKICLRRLKTQIDLVRITSFGATCPNPRTSKMSSWKRRNPLHELWNKKGRSESRGFNFSNKTKIILYSDFLRYLPHRFGTSVYKNFVLGRCVMCCLVVSIYYFWQNANKNI